MMHVIITTIQRPTPCVIQLAKRISGGVANLVVVGDTKGPDEFDLSSIDGFTDRQFTFLDIQNQLDSGFDLATLLPTKHYARKNIGYLHAIHAGATCIYETDDDNGPLDSWTPRSECIANCARLSTDGDDTPCWVNVYKHFSEENIWPRGLPLDRVHTPVAVGSSTSTGELVWAPIQQGLANGAPDVDAVWRLVFDREFCFDVKESVVLLPGQWCPFNTQSTWWWPVVYPLLYVPSYCSFRMCDIWKSFVAQRCLWELGAGVVFHAAEVWQDRNVHNLMRDFNDEVPGYQQNNRIAEILEGTFLQSGIDNVAANLKACYAQLIDHGVFPKEEMALVEAWLSGLKMSQVEV